MISVYGLEVPRRMGRINGAAIKSLQPSTQMAVCQVKYKRKGLYA